MRLQRGRSALLSGVEPKRSQDGREQERDVHRDPATSYSVTYTTLRSGSCRQRNLSTTTLQPTICCGIHGTIQRFLTSASTFRSNEPMPIAWTAALESSQSSNRFVVLRPRTCSYRPANLRLGEPRPWKLFPGEYCRRHCRLLWRQTRCRRAIRQRQRPFQHPRRQHEKQLRVAPHDRR